MQLYNTTIPLSILANNILPPYPLPAFIERPQYLYSDIHNVLLDVILPVFSSNYTVSNHPYALVYKHSVIRAVHELQNPNTP